MAITSQTQPIFICDTDSDRTTNQSLYTDGCQIYVKATGITYIFSSPSTYTPWGNNATNININGQSLINNYSTTAQVLPTAVRT